jgi:hypothetical protein
LFVFSTRRLLKALIRSLFCRIQPADVRAGNPGTQFCRERLYVMNSSPDQLKVEWRIQFHCGRENTLPMPEKPETNAANGSDV